MSIAAFRHNDYALNKVRCSGSHCKLGREVEGFLFCCYETVCIRFDRYSYWTENKFPAVRTR